MWDLHTFYRSVRPLLPRYASDNSWFSWRAIDPESHIFDAWRLYQQAYGNSLGFLLLGDAKIRSSGDLLRNFGLTSGNGLSDERELQQIRELERQRGGGPAGNPVPKVLGPGSILNDKQWTPLLNDAFILGGVHRNQDFHWAEAGFQQYAFLGEREFLERRDKFGAAAPQYQAALRRDEAYYKSKWRHYLIGGANFWSGGFVRVFARELIGLKTFGYSPVFTGQTLSFAGAGRGATATFGEYLSALSGVNFGRQDSAAINAAIGEFLFDDARFLRPEYGPSTNIVKPLRSAPNPPDWPT